MKLQIDKYYVHAMVEQFPPLVSLIDQLKFGNKAEVRFNQLSLPQLAYLHNLYEAAGPQMQACAAQLATLQHAMNDEGKRFTSDELEEMVPAIAQHIVDNAIKGWLYRAYANGRSMPYLITRLDYTPPGEEETGRILIELKANSRGKVAIETLSIHSRDIENKTVSEVLAEKGYFKETESLMQVYNSGVTRYFDWRPKFGMQFTGKGTGIYAEDPTATHRDKDWARKTIIVLSSGEGDARLVNDESILSERALALDASGDIVGKYLRKAGKSDRYDSKVENAVEEFKATIPKGVFTELPVHAFMLMFHMELHHHLWVHVDDMELYVYQPDLKNKLVLPPEHTDLIDILTAEMDVLMDDIVAGKSGGTTVLCAGPPGVGKTLTAEVYSEIIRRPLYRVHSGQLGLSVGEMEKALKETLTRAQRWGAVMLIDEADVYIKRRDDNIAANAVVGVFLRVLEYFNGLLFLTTNRVDDIDEAIVSRCIAMIKYSPPNESDRYKIWSVMTKQFSLVLHDRLLSELVSIFPKATGRDIKGLAKLVAKYCQHKHAEPTIDVFKRCSVFRGMDINTP